MNKLYKVSSDGKVAVDPLVQFYPIDSVPTGLKVQLLTDGGVTVYGIIEKASSTSGYQGWRPVPSNG